MLQARPSVMPPSWAALALVAAVLLVQALPRLWPVLLSQMLLLACGVIALWLGPRSYRWLWLVAALVWGAWCGQAAMDARLPPALQAEDLEVSGEITDLPHLAAGASSLLVHLHTLPPGPAWQGTVRLAWYRAPPVEPCQRWRWRVRLRRPRGLLNPGVADSERSALEHGIDAVGYVRSKSRASYVGSSLCIDGARAAISRRIASQLANSHASDLLRAFAVADISEVEQADWEVARANGIPHLIAISGFHVGVAGWFGSLLLRLLYALWPSLGLRWPRPLACQLAALWVAAGYCGLAGFGVPCLRTLLMMACAVGFRVWRRGSQPGTGLQLALIAVLLVDPLASLSAGFWLSFVGVSLLMFGLQQRHRGWRGWLHELTIGQWLMTATMLPITLWFFGEASLVGAVSNLLAVPWISFVVVPLTLLSLPWLWLWPTLAHGLLWLAASATEGLWLCMVWMQHWPGAHWHRPSLSLAALGCAGLGVVWLLLPRGAPLRWLGGLLLLPLLWPPRALPAAGACRVWALDVGQGLALLVETRHHLLLYDTGARYPSGYDLGAAVVVPAIYAIGRSELDLLLVSHGDNDHAGGAAAVAAAFPKARRVSGEPQRMSYSSARCQAGQQWQWDAVRFEMLAPSVNALGHGNASSCVLRVTTPGGQLLLTGDISAEQERALASQLQAAPAALLQVPHHGSRSASSEVFLQALKPGLAWVSAGWHNRFGHPHTEVVERYRGLPAVLWNTAEQGAMQFEMPATGKPWLRQRWRQRQARYWRE